MQNPPVLTSSRRLARSSPGLTTHDAHLTRWTEMLVVADGYDTAIKVLLPVQLDEGYSITFGVAGAARSDGS